MNQKLKEWLKKYCCPTEENAFNQAKQELDKINFNFEEQTVCIISQLDERIKKLENKKTKKGG